MDIVVHLGVGLDDMYFSRSKKHAYLKTLNPSSFVVISYQLNHRILLQLKTDTRETFKHGFDHN